MTSITLINPNVNPEYGTLSYYPPLGQLYIASFLRENGYPVNFIDADNQDLSHEEIIEVIQNNDSKIIGITCLTAQLNEVYKLSEFLKTSDQEYTIIVGGPHPSAIPVEVLNECKYIDVVVIGEGEHTFLEIVQKIENGFEYNDVQGIASWVNGEIIISEPRILIKDIDELPLPAYDLIESFHDYPGTYPSRDFPSMYIMGSRGCPFKCSFCSDAIWKGSLRKRDPIKIIDEAELLITKYGIKEIFFQDDTFNIDKKWFSSICNEIIKRDLQNKCTFKCPMRANKNLISDEIFSLAKKANFWIVFFGVESGSQKVLDEIDKNLTKDEIIRAFAIARKFGIKTIASFIIGNYPEDKNSVYESIAFAKEINPDYIGAALLIPYPGTQIYSHLKEEKRMTKSFLEYKIGEEIFIHPNIPEGEMKRSTELFNMSFPECNQNTDLYFPSMVPLDRQNVLISLNITQTLSIVKNNEIFTIPVTLSNHGMDPLNSFNPNPVFLSYHWKDDSGIIYIHDGIRTPIKSMLKPNKTKRIQMKIMSPDKPGNYILEITMVQEGCFWFEDILESLPIQINMQVILGKED